MQPIIGLMCLGMLAVGTTAAAQTKEDAVMFTGLGAGMRMADVSHLRCQKGSVSPAV